jgi:hypothetical protein
MGRHQAYRTAGGFPRIGTRPRATGPLEPRGRQSGESAGVGEVSELPLTQAMAILERIAQRRAESAGLTSAWADRIQLVP